MWRMGVRVDHRTSMAHNPPFATCPYRVNWLTCGVQGECTKAEREGRHGKVARCPSPHPHPHSFSNIHHVATSFYKQTHQQHLQARGRHRVSPRHTLGTFKQARVQNLTGEGKGARSPSGHRRARTGLPYAKEPQCPCAFFPRARGVGESRSGAS